MKKLLLIAAIVLLLGLLVTGLAAPILAHGPNDGGTTPENEDAWQAMHEACESGAWPAMTEAAEQVHGDDFDDVPCHDDHDSEDHRGDMMGSHMGRGMMGW